jgi:hypothetical protein
VRQQVIRNEVAPSPQHMRAENQKRDHRLDEISIAVAAISADLKATKATVEDIAEMQKKPRRSPQRDRRPPRDYEGMRRRSPPQYSLGKKIVLF